MSSNKFNCAKCNKKYIYVLFINKDNPDQLGTICHYCQTDTAPVVRCTRKEPYDYERKCVRCGTIRNVDQFVWTSKDGKRNKIIKTCIKCRSTDNKLRTKHKSKPVKIIKLN